MIMLHFIYVTNQMRYVIFSLIASNDQESTSVAKNFCTLHL